MRHARPTGLRARRTTSAVAASAAAAVLLSACGGEPGAQETVGPTAGAPSPTSEQSYAPTLPPYTSDIELTHEEEQDVEELLLLIDEFNILTGTLEDGSPDRASSLEGSVDKELLESHIDGMKETLSDGIRTRGPVTPMSAIILEHSDESAVASICYDFSAYQIFNIENPDKALYPDRPSEHAYDTAANRVDGDWVIVDRTDSESTCEDH